jgi:hypothetical protein
MAIEAGTEKLKEYYSKTGGPVESQYALAAMLDPSQKLGIFESPEWGRPWIRKYTKEFVEHWSANYRNLAVTRNDQLRSPMAPQTLNGIFQQNWQSGGYGKASIAVMNEAEQYLRAAQIGTDSEIPVLQLWKRIVPSYPSLASMARDILAVPGMLIFISVTLKIQTNITSERNRC